MLRSLLLATLLLAACSQGPTESQPIERGTALPPPGLEMPAGR